jgi:hypothetical protein
MRISRYDTFERLKNLSGLQGGQAGEYYHLTAAQNTNIANNVFPAGTSTNTANKLLLPTNTTAGWNALTPTETLVGWDSTKKKPVVGNGTAIVPIGGGLTVTNITVSGTTPSIATLESGKHYIYNGAGASGDVTITMPAVAAESNIRVTVYNIPTTRKMSLARAGSDNFRKDDTLYTTVEFRAVEIEQSSEFVAATDAAEWLVNDGSNALGTTWSGDLTVTGDFTPQGGIVGKTDGVAVAAGYTGEIIGTEQAGTNGVSYNTRTTTVATTGGASLISLSLNKGLYIIGFNIVQVKAGNTNNDRLSTALRVGGTAVITEVSSSNNVVNGGKLSATFSVPIKITADSTTVDVLGVMSTDNAASAANSMWAVRFI